MMQTLSIKAAAVCCPDIPQMHRFGLEGYDVDKSLLPVGIRRRTSLSTRLAITAGVRACEQAGVQADRLPSIFASVGGEIQITDALCRALPDQDALISPTQFHNSVHNTTAGYWGILNHCQQPSTAIAATDDTFAMGLLETWSQLQQNPGDALLVCFDELWPQYLAPPIGLVPFASAFIMSNINNNKHARISLPRIRDKDLTFSDELLSFIESSPAAAAIPLLQALSGEMTTACVPLNINSKRWFTQLEKPDHERI